MANPIQVAIGAASAKRNWDWYGNRTLRPFQGEPEDKSGLGRKIVPFVGAADTPTRSVAYSLTQLAKKRAPFVTPVDLQKTPGKLAGLDADVFIEEVEKLAQVQMQPPMDMGMAAPPPMLGSNEDKAGLMRSILLTMLVGDHQGSAVSNWFEQEPMEDGTSLGGMVQAIYKGEPPGVSTMMEQENMAMFGMEDSPINAFQQAQSSTANQMVSDSRLRNVLDSLRQQRMGLALQG